MARAALVLLFLLLPLGTTPMEGATLLVAGAALLQMRRGPHPFVGPALAVWAALVLAELGGLAVGGPDGANLWRASLAAWAWVLLVVAPPVLSGLRAADRDRLEVVGLGAAGVAGIWAAVEIGLAGAPPWVQPVDGPFSHHLTLGYAVLPALARALHGRRWWAAVPIALGVVCAGSSGPALSAVVLVAALVLRPAVAVAGGALVAVCAVTLLAGDGELLERAVLWTAGAEVALENPHGTGESSVRAATALAQERVLPGFHFPLHAHDSALQGAARAGWGMWVAAAWALVALWRRTDRAGRAAIAAIGVGGLTQDTLGDLEVVRALCAWVMLPLAGATASASAPREPDAAPDVQAPGTQETR